MAALLITVFTILILVAGVVSCLQTPTDQLPGNLPRPIWLLIIVLLSPLGGIAWFLIRWVSRAEANSADGTVSIPRNPLEIFRNDDSERHTAQQPVPPDDNPDFLFSLEAQMRRKRLAEEAQQRRQQKERSDINRTADEETGAPGKSVEAKDSETEISDKKDLEDN